MSTDDMDARLNAAGERWRAANKTIADVDLGYLEIPAEPIDVPITPASNAAPRRRRMRALIGSASGIAAAAAAVILVVQLSGSGSKDRPDSAAGRSGIEVVCQATQPASTEQLQADSAVIAQRIDKLNPDGGSVHIRDNTSLVITLPKGSNKDSAPGLCTQARLDFRPLVMPATAVGPAAETRNSDPFRSLTFAIPTTDTGFTALSAAQRSQLSAALGQLDCAWAADQPRPAASYAFACDADKNLRTQLAYLLGPVVVPGTEIASATGQPPNVSAGMTEWTVAVDLKPSAQAAWADYTGAHNVAGSQGGATNATQCGGQSTPCADYVGVILDGVAVSVPVTQSRISGATTQIIGSFSEKEARALAAQLSGGSLAVPLRVISTTVLSGPGRLVGTDWRLAKITDASGAPLVVDARLTIDSKGQLTGTDGCNSLGAHVTITGDTITIGSVVTTEMACTNPSSAFAAQVARLDKVLDGTVQWSVQGDELTLSKDGAAVLIYRAAPPATTDAKALTADGWRLTAVSQDGPNSSSGSSVSADAPLKFDGKGRFTASDGCNSGSGKVTITEGKMVISGYISTKRACTNVDPAQTQTVTQVLDGNVSWSIKDGQLTLTKAGVGSLTYAQPAALPTNGSS